MDETRTDVGSLTYRDIRVPSRVARVWRDETGWFCALEDGRVFIGHWPTEFEKDVMWLPFLPAVPDR